MRFEAISKWAKSRGVNVERVNSRRIDVFTNGGTVEECHNLAEVIASVWDFINHPETK